MKTVLAVIFLTATTPAFAAVGAGANLAPHYTCEHGGLSRVALKGGALKHEPAACCDGQFGCPQLLSNTGLIKPRRNNHT